MSEWKKKVLNKLSKDALIYIIEQYIHSSFLITEVCVDESKCHISSDEAIDKIRNYIYDIEMNRDVNKTQAYYDMKMSKISAEEYRKMIGVNSPRS